MTLFRTDGIVRRSANPAVGRCCCGADSPYPCISNSGTQPANLDDLIRTRGRPSYVGDETITPACMRALVWKKLHWTVGSSIFDEWSVSILADWILRIAAHCSGTGFDRSGWAEVRYSNAYPIVSRCWNYNPCSGLGNFDYNNFKQDVADEDTDFFVKALQPIKGQLDALASRSIDRVEFFSVGIFVECFHWGTAAEDPDNNTYHSGIDWLAGIKWDMSIMSLSDEEIVMVENAVLENTGC